MRGLRVALELAAGGVDILHCPLPHHFQTRKSTNREGACLCRSKKSNTPADTEDADHQSALRSLPMRSSLRLKKTSARFRPDPRLYGEGRVPGDWAVVHRDYEGAEQKRKGTTNLHPSGRHLLVIGHAPDWCTVSFPLRHRDVSYSPSRHFRCAMKPS
jgi:hypothetical protein